MPGTGKDAANVRFPPPIVGIAAVVIGHLLGRFFPLLPGYELPTPARYWVGGGVIAAAATVFGFWPIRQFRQTGQDVTPWSATPEIVRSGPYKFTRNPMYLMMLLVCLGFAILLSDAWIVVLTPVCALIIHRIAIKPEEEYLEAKFGDAYRDYKRRVRRWI